MTPPTTFDIVRDRIGNHIITTARVGVFTPVRTIDFTRSTQIFVCAATTITGQATKHPADGDVPFLGALTAVTRAVTDGVANNLISANQGRDVMETFMRKYPR